MTWEPKPLPEWPEIGPPPWETLIRERRLARATVLRKRMARRRRIVTTYRVLARALRRWVA